MTDISSNLEKIITKLDDMTSEVVEKQYGTDIASRVEHISKRLDFVEGGGGSAGGVMVVKITTDETGNDTFDHTWREMYDSIANDVPVLVLFCDVGGVGSFTDVVSLEKIAENELIARLGNGDGYMCSDPDGYPAYVNE